MTEHVRAVHFINQFFGGIGGEEQANAPVEVRDGPLGPGRVLQQGLGERLAIAATIIGGENYMSDQRDMALTTVREALARWRPAVLVAGPAFDAGRYGLACGEVCGQAVRWAGVVPLRRELLGADERRYRR